MPFIQLPWIRLHYLEAGDGRPLIWLPGGNDSAVLMLHAHRRLAARVRLVCMDPRGQGESDARQTPEEYAPAEHVRDPRRAAGPPRAGTGDDRRPLARRAGERRVCAGQSGAGPGGDRRRRAAAGKHAGPAREREPLPANAVRRGCRRLSGAAPLGAAPSRAAPLLARRRPSCRSGRVDRAVRGADAARSADGAASLAETAALFLTGDRDFVRTHIEQAAAATEQARLALVPDAGHAVFGDNPGDYFSALESFLDDVLGWTEDGGSTLGAPGD